MLPLSLLALAPALQEPTPLPGFETTRLSDEFYAEGATFGDLDGDGANDIVYGPFWFAGPDFETKHRYYEQEPFDPSGYSNHFFDWIEDVDGDGSNDILMIGFPGKESFWYENPGRGVGEWKRHLVFATVDNESPTFADLTGDGAIELLFHTGGRLGWAAPDPDDATKPWTFHALSEDIGVQRFTHGYGVGDLNGDGRNDVLLHRGWWEQPASLEGDPVWKFHEHRFGAGYGGAQMLVYDVDGDRDNDVVTSLNAHRYGLSWFENVRRGGEVTFVEHGIASAEPKEGDGYRVSELHALAAADFDGDGLTDFVTGKRYWSHGRRGEPGSEDPPYVHWFQLVRGEGGVEFVPRLIHDDSGVGVQVVAGDVDGDGRVDVVVGNKQGAYVHLQRESGEQPVALEPAADDPFPPGAIRALGRDGEPVNLDFETGTIEGWTAEGEAFQGMPNEGDTVDPRHSTMVSDHAGTYWVGTYEVAGDGPTGTLTSEPFIVPARWAAFLVAGGAHPETRVDLVLVDGDRKVLSAVGRNHEALRPTVVDLEAHVGQELYVRLVDEHTGGWGHINFDDMRFYEDRPRFDDEVVATLDIVANAGLTPEEAPGAMTVPDGFRVDLVAGEPDLHQPIALAIDERGRLWVAEAHSYPVRRPDGEGEDKVLIFEDADGDGSFETRKVFADGLNLVSGLEVGFGGVWVGAAPELLFIPDADGDDVADAPPRVLLDGWGYQDTHETLNAFTWGPDGWLYGCHGVFTHSNVGPPGASDEDRTKINAGVWRYHPTRHEFEVFAWGSSNPWGVDFDDNGQSFITACVIPHLFHMVQGGRYHRQAGSHFNPHVYADITTIADHRHWIGSTPHSGNNRSDSAGGGHAHCGAMIYLGDSFPAEYRNAIFFSNIHGNRINVDRLERDRSGFVGRHADDFLLANDSWFRGVNMRYGPDGSVYLIDWYDERACHDRNPEVWTRTNGRMYRVSYGADAPAATGLAGADEDELIERQLSANDWDVRTARRLLAERGVSARGVARLEQILDGNEDPTRRLRALWALHASEALSAKTLARQLSSEHEYVRAWAIQLACEGRAPTRATLRELARMALADPSPVVRLYLASALQRIPKNHRWDIAQNLVLHEEDADDPNLPFLIWYGVEPLVVDNPGLALRLASVSRIPRISEFVYRRAASEDACHDELFTALERMRTDDDRARLLGQAWEALESRRELTMPAAWPAVYHDLSKSDDRRVRDTALALAAAFGDETAYPDLRAMLSDDSAKVSERELALDSLLRGKDPETAVVLEALLDDEALRGRAIRGLATYDRRESARALIARYAAFSAENKADAISTLTSRASYATELLEAMGRGVVARADLTAFDLRKLKSHGDERIDGLIAEVWGVFREVGEDKAAEIERWKGILDEDRLGAADLPLGRDVFARTCMRCHTLYGEGAEIGPDITGSNRSDIEYLLKNSVDPNAEIPKEYEVTIVLTTDGRIVNGILKSETADAVTLQTENEVLVLARSEIDVMKADENSMMPEDQLQTLTEEEVVALVAYLRHDRQVPRRMTPDAVGEFFDGKTLAGWIGDADLWSVEDGEIVGRSPGLDRNEFLKSDFELGDFHLSFDIKLTPNAGNGGVQFRSRTIDGGDVAGLQADVGAGWWGKLYDEHGRALLWDRPGDEHVRADAWNRYEILAVGDRVQTRINGELCVDFVDSEGPRRGIVALQMHSGGALEIRFRDFRLELDPPPPGPPGDR